MANRRPIASLVDTQFDVLAEVCKHPTFASEIVQIIFASQNPTHLGPDNQYWFAGSLPNSFPKSYTYDGKECVKIGRLTLYRIYLNIYEVTGFDSPDMHSRLFIQVV